MNKGNFYFFPPPPHHPFLTITLNTSPAMMAVEYAPLGRGDPDRPHPRLSSNRMRTGARPGPPPRPRPRAQQRAQQRRLVARQQRGSERGASAGLRVLRLQIALARGDNAGAVRSTRHGLALAQRIVELTRRIPEVAGGRVETRFAHLFLKLADRLGQAREGARHQRIDGDGGHDQHAEERVAPEL